MISRRTDRIDADRARALAGLLDLSADTLDDGRLLRPMWHLPYLLPRPAQRDLGPDGHPVAGDIAPPEPGLRRMFAGGRLHLSPGLRIGSSVTARTTVGEVREREGTAGRMVFVTLTTEIKAEGAVVASDERDLVYLHERPGGADRQASRAAAATGVGPGVLKVAVDETLLFRFSALTYNAHRIHYDRDYARDVEGYDGLVVHGPLQALLMAEAATEALVGPLELDAPGPLRFSYRLMAPLMEHQGLVVHRGDVTADGVDVAIADSTSRITARGRLERPPVRPARTSTPH